MRTMRTMQTMWLAVALTSNLAACLAQDDGPVEVDGDPLADAKADRTGSTALASWHWANETPTEFEASGAKHLAWDAPMAKRLQFWADAADAALRAKYPTRYTHVPKPTFYVDTSQVDADLFGEANALTRQVQVCLGEEAKLEQPGYTAFDKVGFLNSGFVMPITKCLARPHYETSHSAIIASFNRAGGACKLSDDGTAVTFGKDCPYGIEFSGGPKSGKDVAYPATSRYIAVEPALIKALPSEDELLYVLFHELGHYYRAHLSVAANYYNYFYALDKVAPGGTPSADPAFASLTSTVRGDMLQNLTTRFQYDFAAENKQVAAQHLGFYTMEQDADDFALELLAAVGIDPHVEQASLLDLAATWEKDGHVPAGELTAAQCRALAGKNWLDASGAPVHVALGSLADLHHSPCWRAWNASRELTARHLSAQGAHPTPPGPTWSALLGTL